MLISLKKRAEPVHEPGAFDLLTECHERIRRFTKLAEWLAHAADAPDAAVKETAESVLRYYTVALPKHSTDEDESLAPRLLALAIPEELRVATTTMTRQHATLEETIAGLLPGWRAVAEDPRALPDHAPAMVRLVDQLRALWDAHLYLEETIVFPAARARLSASAQRDLLREMRARR